MKHYLDSEEYGPFLKTLLVFYAFFVIVLLFLGMGIFYLKTGLEPVRIFEYYRGSEATLLLFPEFEDHFINPKTISGMLKIAIPHLSGYALVIFITSHLTRSLEVGRMTVYLPWASSILGFLDIIGSFMMMYGPFGLAYFRLVILLLFTFVIFWQNATLAWALIRR